MQPSLPSPLASKSSSLPGDLPTNPSGAPPADRPDGPVEEMQAASVMFHLAGVDKKVFMAEVAADPLAEEIGRVIRSGKSGIASHQIRLASVP